MSRLPRRRPGRREREMNSVMLAAVAGLGQQDEANALIRLRDRLASRGVNAELRDNNSALMVHRQSRGCRCGCSSGTAGPTTPGRTPKGVTRWMTWRGQRTSWRSVSPSSRRRGGEVAAPVSGGGRVDLPLPRRASSARRAVESTPKEGCPRTLRRPSVGLSSPLRSLEGVDRRRSTRIR